MKRLHARKRFKKQETVTDEALKQLKKKYAILKADKASNTFVLHCKKWLSQQTEEEIEKSQTYTVVKGKTKEKIIKDDCQFVSKEKNGYKDKGIRPRHKNTA